MSKTVYVVSGYTDLGDGAYQYVQGVYSTLDSAKKGLKKASQQVLSEIYEDAVSYPKNCLSLQYDTDENSSQILGNDDAYIEGLLAEISISQHKLEN